eukprot:NODE_13381_length_245_cov_1.200000.p2 GENE.NODE_13381_length_245_cov_1.200000~~NODE_13381_length_245_cov_1.200000.p2  ORF type:complete len:53 (-),score=1.11 NODE_13381_length_245_cov_1.200000:85-243(-)
MCECARAGSERPGSRQSLGSGVVEWCARSQVVGSSGAVLRHMAEAAAPSRAA